MPASDPDRRKLQAALGRLRDVYEELAGIRAGVALLHLEATVAALESRLGEAAPRTAA